LHRHDVALILDPVSFFGTNAASRSLRSFTSPAAFSFCRDSVLCGEI
jgi:hypothetical protein